MKNIIGFGVLFLSLGAAAENQVIDEDPCNTPNGGARAGILCADKRATDTNISYEKALESALKRLREENEYIKNPKLKQAFMKSNHDWWAFVVSECYFTGLTLTDSPWQSVQIMNCEINKTLERIKYLNNVFYG